VLLAAVALWLLAPVGRVPVAVAPVVNQTGYAELDPYRLALTQELIAQLSASTRLRVVPYDRLLQIVRRYRQGPADVSSREAMQAVATQSGAAMVIVPTLLNDNGALRARVDLRDVVTATSVATYETDPVVSSLVKDSAYGLMMPVATAVRDHTRQTGSWRARAGDTIRSLTSPRPPPRSQLRTLDAAAAFERAVDAYAQQEYAAALTAFADAAQLDPGNALPLAWKSRAARMMRQDDTMAEAASAAGALLSNADESSDRPLVEAMVAEARRDLDLAADRYSAYAEAAPDEAGRVLELAAFNERRGRGAEAIAAYHRALALDDRLARPHLDLCRLYNPNELASAREHGQQALAAFRQLGTRAEEAHALWCLVDILRLGDAAQVTQARQFADDALAIFRAPGYPYNLARALNYVALAASAQGRVAEAATLWSQSLAAAREVGNAQLQPLALMNLGFMHVRLGHRAQAVDFYQQGARGFELLGLEQRAAELRANAANIRIENGDDPDQGMRDAQNALLVARKLGLPNFEVLATQLMAAYYRYAGRHAEAERELNRALSLAKERDLRDDIGSLTTDLARSRLAQGDYDAARRLLEDAVGMSAGIGQTHARIRLAEAYLATGDLGRARAALAQAEDDLTTGAEPELMAPLAAAMGRAAYESGDLSDARRQFSRAAALWTDNLPDAESVEAVAYLGLFDGLGGQPARGREQIIRSLEQSRKMGRVSLETRCRVFLARLQIASRDPGEAARTLAEVPPDSDTVTRGKELRAQVHYWSAQAKTALGDLHGAAMDHAAARQLIMELQTGLSAADRPRFAARPDIQRIIG
jgi:tetratricopeptide (TPR) repeat protein/TolB-like protein